LLGINKEFDYSQELIIYSPSCGIHAFWEFFNNVTKIGTRIFCQRQQHTNTRFVFYLTICIRYIISIIEFWISNIGGPGISNLLFLWYLLQNYESNVTINAVAFFHSSMQKLKHLLKFLFICLFLMQRWSLGLFLVKNFPITSFYHIF
jgi:hypothetical protein